MSQDGNNFLSGWRRNFLAGLAISLPAIVSIAVVVWLFQNVAHLTDWLLIFLPQKLTHDDNGNMLWYWSCVAFLVAMLLICVIGRIGRVYIGRKIIAWGDARLMSVPLLNKIYGTVKQVNESFSNNKSAFQQVVLVTYPHPQSKSVGFVTGEHDHPGGEKLLSVFVPTTPNPTSGFLLFVPEREVEKLDMSVGDGIKFVISLGAISPGQHPPSITALPSERDKTTRV